VEFTIEKQGFFASTSSEVRYSNKMCAREAKSTEYSHVVRRTKVRFRDGA
jgi:hypothetical protein